MATPGPGDGECFATKVYRWEGGHAILFFYSTSKPIGSEPSNSSPNGRLFLSHFEIREVFDVDSLQDHQTQICLPTISGEWDIEDPTSLEATPAWASASAILDASPRLPTDACANCKCWIIDEIHAAMKQAAEIQYRVLEWCFVVRVETAAPIPFEDYLVLTAEENASEERNHYAINQDVKVDMFAGDDGSVETCSVCLDEIKKGSIAGRMPCGHMFHSGCIIRWIGHRNTCPVCRFRIPIETKSQF